MYIDPWWPELNLVLYTTTQNQQLHLHTESYRQQNGNKAIVTIHSRTWNHRCDQTKLSYLMVFPYLNNCKITLWLTIDLLYLNCVLQYVCTHVQCGTIHAILLSNIAMHCLNKIDLMQNYNYSPSQPPFQPPAQLAYIVFYPQQQTKHIQKGSSAQYWS